MEENNKKPDEENEDISSKIKDDGTEEKKVKTMNEEKDDEGTKNEERKEEENKKTEDKGEEPVKEQIKTEENDKMNQKNTATKKALALIKEKSLAINALLLALAILFGYLWYTDNEKAVEQVEDIGAEQAENKIVSFIEENMVQPGTKVNVKGISVEKGLYKADLDIMGQSAITYLSKDGSTFYPQGYDISEVENQKDAADQQPATEAPKSAKPEVDVFVMSYCPYGTQIEKGLLPVAEALGDSIDLNIKFVDYAMHGTKEIEENVRQYCIGKNEPQKFNNYLSCFLKEGDSAGCLKSQSINASLLTKCTSDTDAQFAITEKANDKESWQGTYPPFDINKEDNEKYSVQGSPTLVINGTIMESKRDPASLLKTICSAFENEPESCNTELSSATPAPGFGEGEAAASTDASCN